jgi:hypothetical protein
MVCAYENIISIAGKPQLTSSVEILLDPVSFTNILKHQINSDGKN